MLIYRNAEGVHGQRKFGNPCSIPIRSGVMTAHRIQSLDCSCSGPTRDLKGWGVIVK